MQVFVGFPLSNWALPGSWHCTPQANLSQGKAARGREGGETECGRIDKGRLAGGWEEKETEQGGKALGGVQGREGETTGEGECFYQL